MANEDICLNCANNIIEGMNTFENDEDINYQLNLIISLLLLLFNKFNRFNFLNDKGYKLY